MMEEPIAEKPALFQPLKAGLARLWQTTVDVVTPPLCLACRAPVTRGAALCLDCWQQQHFIEEPVCDALGTPFAYDEGEGALSPAAIAEPPAWNKGRAAVAFDEASKHLVHMLKYQDTPEAGHAMARMMAGAGRSVLAEADYLVPVPLHKRRLWQRRFNQAALLAFEISRISGKPCKTEMLVREKPTRQQVGLSANDRRKNVGRAFAVPAEQQAFVHGKTIVLIDDVRTTGATANACASALKSAGAAKIHLLTFALVLEPTRLHIEA
jgi:ComF family protein